MRTKFSNGEIGHVWFHGTQGEHGKGNSMFFEGDTIYSYGYHYPIARKNVAPGVHLFNSVGSTKTTESRHKPKVYTAIHGNGKVIHVPNVMATTKEEHKANYNAGKEEIARALKKASRARKNASFYIDNASSIAKDMDFYSKTFKLGYRAIVIPVDLSDIAESLKKESARKKKENAAKLAKQKKEQAETIENWLTGNSDRVPRMSKVYMRINGDNIETSHHVNFPVDHAILAFKIVKRCVDNKTGWKTNGHTIKLGYYGVDSISSTGTVKAGCHTVEYDQIERCAKELGLIGA